MKILITYYSMTGNTAKLAQSMHEALAGEEVVLEKIEDLDPSTLKTYDLVLLGSGIYAGALHKSIKELLKNAPELPSKFVLFYTHATIDPVTYQTFPKKIRKLIDNAGSKIEAEFECLGEQKGVTEEEVQKRLQSLPPAKRKTAEDQVKFLKGHPNSEDLENAKTFAKSLI